MATIEQSLPYAIREAPPTEVKESKMSIAAIKRANYTEKLKHQITHLKDRVLKLEHENRVNSFRLPQQREELLRAALNHKIAIRDIHIWNSRQEFMEIAATELLQRTYQEHQDLFSTLNYTVASDLTRLNPKVA